MIPQSISQQVVTIGPEPSMQGGIAQVLSSYFNELFVSPRFVPDTVAGSKMRKLGCGLASLCRLAWLGARRKARVAHIHTACSVSFERSSVFAAVARMLGMKVVMHMHGCEFKQYASTHQSLVHKTLSRCDAIVALSQSWRDFFVENLGMDRVVVIDNIVSTPVVAERDADDGVVKGLFLGALGDRKGIFDLLRAMSRRKADLRGRFVLHVGGNGEVDRFKEVVERLDLQDMVHFHGWVTKGDKAKLLTNCQLYILPSYNEGVPISVLEAMSYGLPVISTPVGGIAEVVGDDNGALVTPGDVDSLGQALVDMVADPEKMRAKGEASLRRISPHLAANVERELTDLYTSLLK